MSIFNKFNNLTEAKIANELMMSVQPLNIELSCVLFPGLYVWPNLRLFIKCRIWFWSITRNEINQSINLYLNSLFLAFNRGIKFNAILVSSMFKVSSKEFYNGCSLWLQWCNLPVSHEGRLLWSEDLTRKQLTAAILLLACNDMRVFGFSHFSHE